MGYTDYLRELSDITLKIGFGVGGIKHTYLASSLYK